MAIFQNQLFFKGTKKVRIGKSQPSGMDNSTYKSSEYKIDSRRNCSSRFARHADLFLPRIVLGFVSEESGTNRTAKKPLYHGVDVFCSNVPNLQLCVVFLIEVIDYNSSLILVQLYILMEL
ncbi:hypothetical protein J32TS6_36480 [Virgibacillus pantothenticus]|nr:hypothetical protein J32TS6_36480 [Virgibacillus pantothenticus]